MSGGGGKPCMSPSSAAVAYLLSCAATEPVRANDAKPKVSIKTGYVWVTSLLNCAERTITFSSACLTCSFPSKLLVQKDLNLVRVKTSLGRLLALLPPRDRPHRLPQKPMDPQRVAKYHSGFPLLAGSGNGRPSRRHSLLASRTVTVSPSATSTTWPTISAAWGSRFDLGLRKPELNSVSGDPFALKQHERSSKNK